MEETTEAPRGGTRRLETLSGEECHQLLGSAAVGRLAIVIGGYPEILPVNYAVSRDRILIRTDPGAKLAQARFARVGFQVEGIDTVGRTGWSVLVKGVVHELAERDHYGDELGGAAARIEPWAGGDKAHVLVITPVSISGRRIRA